MRTIKANTKWMAGAVLTGALLLLAPHPAQAQVSFGIGVSNYGAPAYGYGNPYAYRAVEHERWIEREQWQAARAAEWRHEQWEQQRSYGRDRDGRHGWDDRFEHNRY